MLGLWTHDRLHNVGIGAVHRYLRGRRLEVPHVPGIDNVDVAVLAAADEQIRAGGSSRNQERSRRAEVQIATPRATTGFVQEFLIAWREIILHGQRRSFQFELDET